jgi:hypothetical protein
MKKTLNIEIEYEKERGTERVKIIKMPKLTRFAKEVLLRELLEGERIFGIDLQQKRFLI